MWLWTGSLAALPRASSSAAERDRQGGFTLLEVLVAFVILVVALTALLQVFSGGLGSIGKAERYAAATMLARSVLDEVGTEIPLVDGEQSGAAGHGFTWTTRVVRATSVAPVADGDALQVPYDVEVSVVWNGSHLLSLTTLRIAPELGTATGGFNDEPGASGEEVAP